MPDFDAIIVGSGPAGLTAGLHLAEANHKVLVLEKESFGGQPMNLEWVEDYPGPGQRIAGPSLGAELAQKADEAGARLETGEVEEIESYSASKAVSCAGGTAYTSTVVIAAGGLAYKPLGVPAEARLEGKGVIHCAVCDGGLYADRVVAVCGGGDYGLIEAMYLAKFAAKVVVIEAAPELSARPDLQERAAADPKLDIRLGKRAVDILGEDGVSGVLIEDAGGNRETVDAYGALVHVGMRPNTDCLEFLLDLDGDGYAEANTQLETGVPGIILAGDIRRAAPRDVAAAINDGALAAASAMRILSG
jgi:thioredoxin reductase (NADPH)